MTVYFLRQNILRSGDAPLIFRVSKYDWALCPLATEVQKLFSSTQNRWAWVEFGGDADQLLRLNPSKLELAPLEHLSLSRMAPPLCDGAWGEGNPHLWSNLTQLQLYRCDFTYLRLLGLATALEELSVGFASSGRCSSESALLPTIRFKLDRLRKLRVEGLGKDSKSLTEMLWCPALEHAEFYNSVIIQTLESFLGRNRPNLLSLCVTHPVYDDFVWDFSKVLRLLPSLSSLTFIASSHHTRFVLRALAEVQAMSFPPDGPDIGEGTIPIPIRAPIPAGRSNDYQVTVCPSLRQVEIHWLPAPENVIAMGEFVEARRRAPDRCLERVWLESYRWPPGDSCQEAIQAAALNRIMARHVEDGLQFRIEQSVGRGVSGCAPGSSLGEMTST